MTISANGRAPSDDTLERSLELYRDLSVALSEKIAIFKSTGGDPVEKGGPVEAAKEHRKALQTVLDIEASLGKRSRAWIEGTSLELDLLAARAEIVARLAVWLT